MEVTPMKIFKVMSAAALFLLLGTGLPAFAQEGHQDEKAKPAEHQQQAKPAQHEQQAKPARQETQAKPENRGDQRASARQATPVRPAEHAQQSQPAKQERQAQPKQRQEQAKSTRPEPQTKPVRQQERTNPAEQQHAQRTTADDQRQRAEPALRLSSRNNGRIPDDRFRSNFGRGHDFRIGSPRMVGGYSRFQYGGYWFGFVQPWPVGWYYTDDVYIDYVDGGYYLCNPSYPGVRVGISVIL
jgi:hypothetical protein